MNKFETEARKSTRKVAKIVHPNLSVSPSAVNVLAKIFTDFNDKLIAECRNKHKPAKKDSTMRVQVAQKATEKLLSGQLRNLALSNAHRIVTLYAAGALAYTPKHLRKPKKKKGQAPAEFVKSVLPLSRLVEPSMRFAKEAKEAIAQLLFQMSKLVVDKAQEVTVENGVLTGGEVLKAVDFYMSPNMTKHAIAEGSKNAFMFGNGCHYYSQEDFAKKTS